MSSSIVRILQGSVGQVGKKCVRKLYFTQIQANASLRKDLIMRNIGRIRGKHKNSELWSQNLNFFQASVSEAPPPDILTALPHLPSQAGGHLSGSSRCVRVGQTKILLLTPPAHDSPRCELTFERCAPDFLSLLDRHSKNANLAGNSVYRG